MRWADLDTLNHVNNVRYVDYALEAMDQLVADGAIAANRPVSRMEVNYLRPLALSREPLRITSAVVGTQLVQEIGAGGTVFAKVTTSFDAEVPAPVESPVGATYLAQLRRSDIDGNGRVSVGKTFEIFQESRILHFTASQEAHAANGFVVANLVVECIRPITWQPTPVTVNSWLSRVGNASMRVGSQIIDEGRVLATCDAVLVGFDMATQKSRRFSDEERKAFAASLRTP